jgi:DNA-binding NarL/FixJ family response regulator
MDELPLRALVVDDDPRWRTLVTEILIDAGCIVTALAGPPVRPAGYHLAVLDVALNPDAPDNRDGLSLIDRLPGTRILFLSGLADADVTSQIVQRSNVVGLMSKDAFRRDDLIEFVQRVAAAETQLAPAARMRNVLIVEDDAGWRAIYEDILSEVGYAPHCAVSYGEARGWLQRADFALAIVDLHLVSSTAPHDNRDGFWLLRTAHQRGLPTIVVSALGAPEDIDRAYDEFGVFAFVEKEAFDRRAFKRIVTDALQSKDSASRPAAVAPEPAHLDEAGMLLESLTQREQDVLALLTQGYTNRQIGEALRITPNTVKKHVDHILQKLGASNRAAAVAAALRARLPTSD